MRIDIKSAMAEINLELSKIIDLLHEKQAKDIKLTFDDIHQISSLRNSLSSLATMCPNQIYPADCNIGKSKTGHFYPINSNH